MEYLTEHTISLMSSYENNKLINRVIDGFHCPSIMFSGSNINKNDGKA